MSNSFDSNRPNLCIRKLAHAYKILFDENKRAVGVQYNYNGEKNFTAYARKGIILSAGAIESAHLLLLSGIGPKHELAHHKIPLIHNSAAEQTLYDHATVFTFFKFNGNPPPTTESLDDTYEYLIYRTGALSGL